MTRKVGITKRARRVIARDEKSARTTDSFRNWAARLGVGTGNLSDFSTYGFNPISRNRTLLEWMYRGSWLVGKAVDCIAEDCFKAGVSWLGDNDPADLERLTKSARRMLWPQMRDTYKWARLYGGALAVMLIDGQRPETPLREDTVSRGQLKNILVLDRWMVEPTLENLVTDMGSPHLGLPCYYRVTADAPALPRMTIHHSRVARFVGIELPYWQRVAENLWGISVLERLFDRLIAFDSATQGASQLVFRAYLRTLKIKEFRNIVAAGGPAFDGLVATVQAMRQFQSSEGVSIIDDTDTMETSSYSFSGLGEMMTQFGQQISGAIDTPLVRLFGQSPAGLNSTGESDMRTYYDGIEQRQENDIRGQIAPFVRVLARSEGIALAPGFDFEFNPLWQLTDLQKAEFAERVTGLVVAAEAAGFGVTAAAALREMKQQSRVTGIWTNITDGDVKAAEEAPSPGIMEALGAGDISDPDDPIGTMQGGNRFRRAGENGSRQSGSPSPVGRAESGGASRPHPRALPGSRPRIPAPRSHEEHFGDHAAPITYDVGPFPVVIETPRGSRREGAGWSVTMPCDYGYVRGTGSAEGADEQLDCLVGPARDSREVWVIDTVDPTTGRFDEHKVLFCFASQAAALRCFSQCYDDEALGRVSGATRFSLDDLALREWIVDGEKRTPLADRSGLRRVA